MEDSLAEVRALLQDIAHCFTAESGSLSTRELANTVAAVEDVSKTVEFLQAAGAHAVERADIAANGETSASTGALAGSPDASGAAGWANPAAAIAASGTEAGDPGGVDAAVPDGAGPQHRQRRRKTEFRNNAEYLRSRLGISIVEARRRLRVGRVITAPVRFDGEPGAPALPALAEAMAAGELSGNAAVLVTDSIARARHAADPGTLEAMESSLVRQAAEGDADTLAMVAKTWETAVDQDGAEPSEDELRSRQGMFYRGRRRGLHQFVINTTDDQYELLATMMNSAANPRIRSDAIETAANSRTEAAPAGPNRNGTGPTGTTDAATAGTGAADPATEGTRIGEGVGPGSGESEADDDRNTETTDAGALGTDDAGANGTGMPDAEDCTDSEHSHGDVDPAVVAGMDGFTRAQKLLAGLIGACRIALNVDKLPDSGGHRTQVIVTAGYEQLAGLLSGGGSAVFNGSLSAKTVRRMACDAEIIPAILGSKGEVLDLGRSQRFFSRAIRKALLLRDKGCAFPGCSMPAFWTEAHHIVPWWAGGRTDINNGVCLCSLHHDLIEQGNWEINVIDGIPWFTPPDYIDPHRRPLRNTYWQTHVPPRGLAG
ncbi:HNH endonuclease signature motif containing protein [Arthrobacter sulfonylureivorans]|uniref:HNH endonuclease n=1 Tax=Arthrobacter sulfonylureivorans TaxID=2486855 RepID=A0ABY3W6T9_9MICC|nr:HNH endonuclease signature motif containing protein [Arthrobacter sulfonylureivorans]UNK46017.1 HNH endonuclease [Arthrobacter sulfonylureivorans]